MSKPPREGARWGDDPAPEPEPAPEPVPKPQGPPPEYLRLCDEFGENNVKRALAVQIAMREEYPQLPMVRDDPLEFARDALNFARSQIELAAADGRAHSLPETLDIMGEHLGAAFVKNPDITFKNPKDMRVSYDDEGEGKRAKRDNAILLFVLLAAIGIAFAVWGFEKFGTFIVLVFVFGLIGRFIFPSLFK